MCGQGSQIARNFAHHRQKAASPLFIRPSSLALPLEIPLQVFLGHLKRRHRKRKEQCGWFRHWLPELLDLPCAKLWRPSEQLA
jgi:hypothetical protein